VRLAIKSITKKKFNAIAAGDNDVMRTKFIRLDGLSIVNYIQDLFEGDNLCGN
jgi:hypothetical protein